MSGTPQSIGDDDRGGSKPNYLARRMVFTGLIVAVVAIVAIVLGRLIGTGDGDSATVDVDTAWDTMVTVDERTGRITISDPDGSDSEVVSSNAGRVSGTAMIDDTVFIAGGRESVAVNLSGSRDRVVVSDILDGDITIGRPAGSTRIVMFSNGAEAILMGSDLDRVIDTSVAVAAPDVELSLDAARTNGDGSAVLIPDPGNFQSVLLRFDDEPTSYFAGVPLAVDDERVATVQNVGGSATVTVSGHDGTRLSEFTTQPVLAAMLIDGGILTVDRRGVIHRIHPSGDDTVGSIGAPPTAGGSWVATTGDRLIVSSAKGVVVIDPAGEILVSVDGVRAAPTGPAPASIIPLRPGCLGMHDAETGQLQLINLRNGELVAEVSGADEAVLTSADGCTAIAVEEAAGAPTSIALSADGAAPVENEHDRLPALSPDGATVAIDLAGRLVVEALSTADDPADDDRSGDDRSGDGSDSAEDNDRSGEETSEVDGLGASTPFVYFVDL
jgi:hypothetical protein